MRRLFYSEPATVTNKKHSIYYDFVFACSQCPRNAVLLDKLDANFEEGLCKFEHSAIVCILDIVHSLVNYITALESKENVHLLGVNNDLLTSEDIKNAEFRPQRNYTLHTTIRSEFFAATLVASTAATSAV